MAALARLPAAMRPQVVLLDLEMPVMDGMTALPLLLRERPRPAVIVASALTQRGAAAAMAALRAGAADYVPKPGAAGGGLADPAFRAEVLAKVKGWARMARRPGAARRRRRRGAAPMLPLRGLRADRPRLLDRRAAGAGRASSRRLVRPLPVPLLVVQHMPAGFTAMLADHLHRLGRLPCAEARDGEALRAGRLYLAPGDRHLVVEAARVGWWRGCRTRRPRISAAPRSIRMLRSLAASCGGAVLARDPDRHGA